MAKRYAPKQDPAKKEAPSEAANAAASTPGVLNPDLAFPAGEPATAPLPGEPAPAEAAAIGPGARAATSKPRKSPEEPPVAAPPAEAEPLDPANEVAPAVPRRRPVTLDLPAKDLTPPPPRPEPQAAAADAAGAGLAASEKGRKRQSLGLIGASILALAAGLMGGAVAFALVSTFYSAEQNIDSITDLEARALDLRQRVEQLEAQPGQPAPAAPTVVASVPAELTARIEALEGGLTAADAKLAEADSRIAALAEAPAPVAAPAASPEAVQQAEARIAALEGRINEVAAQRQAGTQAARAAAALATLGALEAAIAAGVPYETELQASRTLLGDQAAGLSALEAAALTGLPAGPVLAGRLKAALAEAPAPAAGAGAGAAAPADAGIVDKLWNSASSLVTVRRNSGAAEASSEPAIAAAQDALGRGDVAEALTVLGGLPEASKQKLAAVIGAMEARQAALATVAGVKRQLIADIAGRTP
ncbi:hypothetical protein J2X65_001362 [Ancylobacter sp. 3268]|uniref:COG4223 family protein n=1 Tax=Ancylobacter sp. 3268 TaxID=2817752 RepID=UPI002856E06F|nr:hypothetical protein [Ancylobacter sp. 3268]MDR6952011.1 hypothetical protein [Ancylobacter sp. 3268]